MIKLQDIKNGMSFVMRNGEKRFVINDGVYGKSCNDYELYLYYTLDEHKDKYHEDFTRIGNEALHIKLDIMKIYDCDNNLVWERDEIDWSKLPVDTKLLVKHPKDKKWRRRYYAGVYDPAMGLIYCYRDGKTSWVDKMAIYGWRKDYVKLWDEEEDNEE